MPLYIYEVLFERDSMVMFPILRAIDKRNHATTHVFVKLLNGLGVVTEFQKAAISKLGPL